MRKLYKNLRNYQTSGDGIEVEELEWKCVRAAILRESSNDIQFTNFERNALALTLDGTAKHKTKMEGINDETPTKPGDICFIPQNADVNFIWENHRFLQKTILLDFDQSMFATYAPEVVTENFELGHLIPENFKTCVNLEYILRTLGQEVASKGGRGQIFAESAIRLVALQVANSSWTHPASRNGNRACLDIRARRAIEFIEEHFNRDISLLEIGSAAGLSITQLTQVFQQTTGETPYAYVIARRLRQAVHLLRHSNQPIAHIALDVGFADQAHMTRTFQKKFQKSPKTVRDQG